MHPKFAAQLAAFDASVTRHRARKAEAARAPVRATSRAEPTTPGRKRGAAQWLSGKEHDYSKAIEARGFTAPSGFAWLEYEGRPWLFRRRGKETPPERLTTVFRASAGLEFSDRARGIRIELENASGAIVTLDLRTADAVRAGGAAAIEAFVAAGGGIAFPEGARFLQNAVTSGKRLTRNVRVVRGTGWQDDLERDGSGPVYVTLGGEKIGGEGVEVELSR